MTRNLCISLLLVLLLGANATAQQVWIVVAPDSAESSLAGELTRRLVEAGIAPRTLFDNSEEFRALALTQTERPLLVRLSEQGAPVQVLPAAEVSSLLGAINAEESPPVSQDGVQYSQVRFSVEDRPLQVGDYIDFSVWGHEKLGLTARVGGLHLPMMEEKPGIYQARYQIGPQDRGQLGLSLLDAAGQEIREFGEVASVGLPAPRVTRVEQLDLRNWAVEGVAAPGSEVEFVFAIPNPGPLWSTTRHRGAKVKANADGVFSAVANLGNMTNSRLTPVKVVASSGETRSVGEQEVQLTPRFIYRPDPGYYSGWGPRWGWGVGRRYRGYNGYCW